MDELIPCPIDGNKLKEWLRFHIADFARLADSHRKMEDIRRYNECVEQQTTYEHYLRVVESGKFSAEASAPPARNWKPDDVIGQRIVDGKAFNCYFGDASPEVQSILQREGSGEGDKWEALKDFLEEQIVSLKQDDVLLSPILIEEQDGKRKIQASNKDWVGGMRCAYSLILNLFISKAALESAKGSPEKEKP